MSGTFTADLPAMQRWAEGLMASRPADFVIGDNYLLRWWAIPRNNFSNVYIHDIRKSDDDRALHDHPWDNVSVLLLGGYTEHTPEGSFKRGEGEIVVRPAGTLHRLEVLPGQRAISMFLTGPVIREWGFACGHGWVHWKDFVNAREAGQVGRGCGEHGDLSPVTPIGTKRVQS
jgi:hypothetical protein